MGRGRMTTTKQTLKATLIKKNNKSFTWDKEGGGGGKMLPEIGAGGIDLNSALVGVGYVGFVRAYYYIFEILNNFYFFFIFSFVFSTL